MIQEETHCKLWANTHIQMIMHNIKHIHLSIRELYKHINVYYTHMQKIIKPKCSNINQRKAGKQQKSGGFHGKG